MAYTLLLGTQGSAWHEWLKDHRQGRDLILLDPADAHYGAAGRVWLIQGDRARSRLYGSTDPQRAPHVMALALAEFLGLAGEHAIVQLFAYRPTPLLSQLAQLTAFLVRPEHIYIQKGTEISQGGWPVGPEELELPAGLPPVVVDAQRKAQWLKLIERSHPHQISIQTCVVQGARLGSGHLLDEATRHRAGLANAAHVETCGATLLIVADEDPDEENISRALDVTHTSRAQVVRPDEYEDVLCAFVRPSGDEFGYGMIERIDFAEGLIHARADAIPPVPVPILRLGSLKVDKDGRERGEARPWQV